MRNGIPWVKLLLIFAIAWGGWTSLHSDKEKSGSVSSIGAKTGNDLSASALTALATTVGPGEVVMYTTTHCPYCAQAKGWLNQNGFTFTECDAEARPDCAQALQALGGDGVPFLTVRGKQMRDGFDADEFISLLKG